MPWARAGLIVCSHQPPEICATPGASSSPSQQVQARPLTLVGWMEPAQMELINLSGPWQETGSSWLALWCSINCDNDFNPRCDTTLPGGLNVELGYGSGTSSSEQELLFPGHLLQGPLGTGTGGLKVCCQFSLMPTCVIPCQAQAKYSVDVTSLLLTSPQDRSSLCSSLQK